VTLAPAAAPMARELSPWCTPTARRRHAVLGATLGAVVSWSVSHYVGGVDLVVGSGANARTVGVFSVLLVSLLAGAAALGLATVLSRRAGRPRRTWTVVAGLVLALSLLGPLGATSVTVALALLALHLVVGLGLILGIRPTLALNTVDQK